MNPSIEPAVIAAAAAAAVAIVSFITNRATTRQTIEAGTANTVRALDAARDDRLWEKQTALYEEIITLMLYLSLRHHNELRFGRPDAATEKKLMKAVFGDYKMPRVFELQGRIHTYASDVVVAAFDAAKSAEDSLGVCNRRSAALEEQALEASAAGDTAAFEAHVQALEVAAAEGGFASMKAEETSETLIKLIRSELGIKPSRIPHIEDLQDGQRANWPGLMGPPDPE